MRELRVVGLNVDGRRIICESDDSAKDMFSLRVDDRLRAAMRGDKVASNQTDIDVEVQNVLRPKEIQARIRAGASVEQLATAAGVPVERVERFAHPVLLERARAAELATAAHPVLADGPSVLTLLETVTQAIVARGLDPESIAWDAWRNEDSRWTVQLAWKAGRSDNVAHFRYTPGAHGGTVSASDDGARQLINPDFGRPLRPVAAVPHLFDNHEAHEVAETPAAAPEQFSRPAEPTPAPAPPAAKRSRKARPAVPAWEDVLLGVRSSGTQP
ncbi:septation protein SepH [Mycobacterium sp. 48b]|uniref:septation protein SepH n=1 Tax=Mycobacterium sp. 48b TaxID=3400426 RepID=UPI003AB0AD0C